MSLKILNVVVVVFLSFVISGCSTKKEVVSFNNDMNKLHKEQASDKQSNLDNKKISQPEKTEIAEIVPAENIVSTSTESKVQDNKVVDNLYNTTTSRINGEDVVLKSIHFDFNMFALTEENLIVSAENSTKIKNSSAKNDSFKIKLEGNSDEWGTDEYNYALSLKRTIAVKNDLVNKGISADRIITISYGESNPICKEQTAECWAKNRRVDHYLVP